MNRPLKVLFFANTDWYLYNFRLGLAKYLAAKDIEVVMVSPPGEYGHKLEAAGFRWIQVSMDRRSLEPLAEARLIWELVRTYRRESPDIVHHFTIKCVVYGGISAHIARIRNVVSAVTGLGYVFIGQDWRAKLLRPIVRQFLKLAMNGSNRRLILQNPDDRELFLTASLVKDPDIRLIAGSGVNTQLFTPKATTFPKIAGQTVQIAFAARLLWDKGLREFVEAAKIVHAQGYDAEFLVIGSSDPGNPAAVCEKDIASWKAKIPNLKFLGHVSNISELFDQIDIMVLPSYREGLPRGLIEAAAAGLPIVTTDVPGCRDVVDEGINGFKVPVRNSQKLADAILKLINDPSLALNMGLAGRQKAIAEFDEQIVFKKTYAVYAELNSNF